MIKGPAAERRLALARAFTIMHSIDEFQPYPEGRVLRAAEQVANWIDREKVRHREWLVKQLTTKNSSPIKEEQLPLVEELVDVLYDMPPFEPDLAGAARRDLINALKRVQDFHEPFSLYIDEEPFLLPSAASTPSEKLYAVCVECRTETDVLDDLIIELESVPLLSDNHGRRLRAVLDLGLAIIEYKRRSFVL